jgi:hypothetical protein
VVEGHDLLSTAPRPLLRGFDPDPVPDPVPARLRRRLASTHGWATPLRSSAAC